MLDIGFSIVKQRSWPLWLITAGLLASVVGFTGCDTPTYTREERRSLHLPSGWSLEENSQMLARSYSFSNWITIISRLNGTSQKLFATPYRTPPMPGNSGMFGVLGSRRRQPRPMAPGMPGQQPKTKRKRKKQVYGFYYIIRCNRTVELELRLPVRGRKWSTETFVHPFRVPRTGAGWKRINFLYKDFKPLTKESRSRPNRYRVIRAEFWERKSSSHPPSVSMTIKGPYLYKSKTPPKSSLQATSKPASRPSSRPSSRPTSRSTSKPTKQPGKRKATTQPAPRK